MTYNLDCALRNWSLGIRQGHDKLSLVQRSHYHQLSHHSQFLLVKAVTCLPSVVFPLNFSGRHSFLSLPDSLPPFPCLWDLRHQEILKLTLSPRHHHYIIISIPRWPWKSAFSVSLSHRSPRMSGWLTDLSAGWLAVRQAEDWQINT